MKKGKDTLTIGAIVVYVVGMSLCDNFSKALGIEKVVTFPFIALFTGLLLFFIRSNGECSYYGLKKPEKKGRDCLYYIPLVAIGTVNVWFGVKMNMSPLSSFFYALSILIAGIGEEILFRSLLFRLLEEKSRVMAIVVSSLLFGIGHIVNLFNGSGNGVWSTLLQICYATTIGLVFVLLFVYTGSIIPAMVTHGAINCLSTFHGEGAIKYETEVSIVLIVVSLFYSFYLIWKMKVEGKKSDSLNNLTPERD